MEGDTRPPGDGKKKDRESETLTALRVVLLVAQLVRLIFWHFNCH